MVKEKDMNNVDITTSSFESLIKSGCVYVDKTDYLYSIVRKGVGYYFLSRPRRFGKSLTFSTLEAIFKGKKELFKGLYIGGTDYGFKEYPVIHIDFLGLETRSFDMLEMSLSTNLSWIASDYGVSIQKSYEVGFYCMLRAIGANVNAEVPTNKARIDVSLELGDHIYIFEFKVGRTAEEALSQIKQNGYDEKYNAPRYKGKTLHLVGISFSESDRNIDQILYETHQIQ